MKMLLLKLQVKAEEKERVPELKDLSDKAIIELVPIPPEEFDFLSSNLEAFEEEIKKESATTSKA